MVFDEPLPVETHQIGIEMLVSKIIQTTFAKHIYQKNNGIPFPPFITDDRIMSTKEKTKVFAKLFATNSTSVC